MRRRCPTDIGAPWLENGDVDLMKGTPREAGIGQGQKK